MKTSLFIYISFILLSCTANKHKIEIKLPADSADKSQTKTDTVKNHAADIIGDSVIIAKFPKDSIATTISGLLKETKQVAVYVEVKQGKNLSATLHTKDPDANIRFNQFFTPDRKADGPFGKTISKPILKRGMYKLIIGHDLMAEGRSEVRFELRLMVQ